MNKKKITVMSVVIAIVLGYMFVNNPSREMTLQLGMFVGSNFDVYNADSYALIDETISEFEKEHPNVKIKYESGILKEDYSSWLSKKILNGEQMDMFMVLNEDFNTMASIGALQNLDTYFTDKTPYYENVLASGKYNNHLYAMAYEANPMMLCINKDLLKKEGISIPEKRMTMQEFYEICQKVTKDTNGDGVIDQYGCCNYDWQDAINAYGLQIFDEDGSQSLLAESKDALVEVQKIHALSNGHKVTSEEFDEGKVAFCPLSIAQYRTYEPYPYRISKYSTFSWYCLPMPGYKDNEKTATCQTSLMAVNAKSAHKDLAYDFIDLLTSRKIQQDMIEKSQGVSVRKDVMDSKETTQILSNESDALQLPIIQSLLENIIVEPKFKTYNRVLNKADYLIGQSIENNRIEVDIYSIQDQLTDELKQ